MIEGQTLEQEYVAAKKKSAKPMLWIAMISMVMFFAGLTSAYVMSMKRDDWVSFDLPQAFYISTVLIVLSSVTLFFSQKLLKTFNTHTQQAATPADLIILVVSYHMKITEQIVHEAP